MKPASTSGVVSQPRICTIFPGALGDFICFLPALEVLARSATVEVLARTEFGEIAPLDIVVKSIERPEIAKLFRGGELADDEAHRFFQGYDFVYSWFGSRDPNFVARLQAFTGGRAGVFPFVPESAGCHQADHYLRCLAFAGDSAPQPMVALRDEAVQWADGFWTRHRLHCRPVLAIAPGSGAPEKNWPPEFFYAVSRWWQETHAGAVLVLVGPVEEERGTAEALARAGVIVRALSLPQTAALLSRSRICLGNDSGVLHLAAALDIRTLVLFGPSDPCRWAPRGANVIVLRRDIGCSPCSEAMRTSCSHRACLTELHPDQVVASLAKLPEVVTLTR